MAVLFSQAIAGFALCSLPNLVPVDAPITSPLNVAAGGPAYAAIANHPVGALPLVTNDQVVAGSASITTNLLPADADGFQASTEIEGRMRQAIKEAYASAPAGEAYQVVDTLEFRHPNFIDENGNQTAIRIVNGFKNFNGRLEDSAPQAAGQYVDFVALPFELELPNIEHIAQPEIGFSVDNVSRDIEDNLAIAASSPYPIEVTYRPYLAGDPSKVQMDPPLHFELISAKATDFRVTGRAGYGNAANRSVPRETYTVERFPGLGR